MKKLLSIFLCICILLCTCVLPVYADTEWPSDLVIQAEGGIVIDANTGTVIYGQNIHVPYFPASITKILTALVVIENCDLDEVVTFSRNAVYNVEAGSSNMAMDTGDQLTVRDCLYGLMIKSANEVGNALAEHVSGSIEEFCVLMNKKAQELGCRNSNFANPSGLNNENHVTTAYDMALIAKAAFENETFVEIDSTRVYNIPPTKRSPDGLRITTHHKMMLQSQSVYYPGIIGGKTGYTSKAGNTLVTCAERDGMKLIAVVLNGMQTHYTDTKALLDFGFKHFESIPINEFDTNYLPLKNDLLIAGLSTTNLSSLHLDDVSRITLPKSSDYSAVTSELFYDLPELASKSNALAKIEYKFGNRKIGSAYLTLKEADTSLIAGLDIPLPKEIYMSDESDSPDDSPTEAPTATTETAGQTSGDKPAISAFWIVFFAAIVVFVLILLISIYVIHQRHKEEEARMIRRQKRLERLASSNISNDEFQTLLEKKRSTAASKQSDSLINTIKRTIRK